MRYTLCSFGSTLMNGSILHTTWLSVPNDLCIIYCEDMTVQDTILDAAFLEDGGSDFQAWS